MNEQKIECYFVSTPLANYYNEKRKWKAAHPNAKILEEIKTLGMGVVEVPDPVIIGKTIPQQQIMILYAIIYEEKHKLTLKISGL